MLGSGGLPGALAARLGSPEAAHARLRRRGAWCCNLLRKDAHIGTAVGQRCTLGTDGAQAALAGGMHNMLCTAMMVRKVMHRSAARRMVHLCQITLLLSSCVCLFLACACSS